MSTDVVTLPARTMVLGEKKYVGLYLFQNTSVTFTPTATVTVFDSTGATTLAAQTMTITGTTRVKAQYLLTSGGGLNITTAGTYRLVFTVTNGSEIQIWEQQLTVLAKPF